MQHDVQEVAALAATGRFDHIIVEGSGISEPLPVAAAFAVRGPAGGTLSDVATLDTMVRCLLQEAQLCSSSDGVCHQQSCKSSSIAYV